MKYGLSITAAGPDSSARWADHQRSPYALVFAIVLEIGTILAPSAQAQTFSVLYTFTGIPDASQPYQAKLLDVRGTFYGTTFVGGVNNYGAVFKLNRAGEETVLYSFAGGADGGNPDAGLVQDTKGNLYGTAPVEGDFSCTIFGEVGCGVVYKLDAMGHLTVIHTFTGGTDGAEPQGVIIDSVGNLYGTTFYGGNNPSCPLASGCGVVYKLDMSGNETVLYSFAGSTDGASPIGFLTMDSAGNLYGAATNGGSLSYCSGLGCGVVFKVDTDGKEIPLYAFTGGSDGAAANGSLLLDGNGDLYGTTSMGGDLNCGSNTSGTGCGVVFEVTPSGNEKVLHTFEGTEGAIPSYGLAADMKGNRYGTTTLGGAYGVGTVFEVTARGTVKVLHSFTGGADGGVPYSGLVIGGLGNIYGNTSGGGSPSCNCGTVFKLAP